MDVREKLVEILRKPIFPHELVDPIEAVADYLLDGGVTVQEIGYVVTKTDRWATYHHHCSICDEELEWKAYPNFCSNCGSILKPQPPKGE